MSSQQGCLICTAPPTSYKNYGVKSCRSCADFFKRAMMAGRVLQCTQGNGKCTINPHDRHNCRGCRLNKCKALGMRLLDVVDQSHEISSSTSPLSEERSSVIRGNDVPALMINISSHLVANHSTVSSKGRSKSADISYRKLEMEISTQNSAETAKRLTQSRFIDHRTFYECEQGNSTTPLLDKIRKGFSLMCLIRMRGEKQFVSGDGEQRQVGSFTLHLSDYSTMVPIHGFLKEELIEFAKVAFVQFETLDDAIKESLVERRLTCMDLLESTYRTCHHFPNDKEVRMPGYTTYFKNSDLDSVFEKCQDDVDIPKLQREWSKSVIQLSRMVRYHLEEMNPRDYEFLALLGLTFWKDEYSDEAIYRIAREVQSEIMRELHTYYTANGISEYSNRIGSIFCLLTNCQKCSAKVDEDFEVYRLMNMFEYAFKKNDTITKTQF